ncbi:MAG TPA: hypothetical protein VIN10_03315 [Bacteroidales bacterium]
MKKSILLLVIALVTSFLGVSQTSGITADNNLNFYGIDYTQTYFLTPLDFPNTADLKAKITGWNDLILTERDKYSIQKFFNKSNVEYQFNMIKALNDKIDVESRLTTDPAKVAYLTEADIAKIVSQYNTGDDKDFGLVFIAESYDKPSEMGAYWVTFFDVSTKKVIETKRFVGKAKGFGLRNYWANSYYVVMKDAGKEFGSK